MDRGEAGLDVSEGRTRCGLVSSPMPWSSIRTWLPGLVRDGVAQMPVLLLLFYVSAPGQFELECVSVFGGSRCQLR